MPWQICAGAVQRPLLANVWPGYTGPTIMSTHSLCGAQPDVQLHHEHVVTNSLLQEGSRRNISEKRHNLQGEFHLDWRKLQEPDQYGSGSCTRMGLDGCSKLRWSCPPVAVTVWDSPVLVILRQAHRDKGIKKRGKPEVEMQLLNVREWQFGCYGM